MAPDREIKLTTEELEELKDTIKFRTRVALELKILNKTLNNVPQKVIKLETKVCLLMWGVPIILFIFGIVMTMLTKKP